MRNSKVNGSIYFLLLRAWCYMPSKSTTIVFPTVRLASHFQPCFCTNLCYHSLSPDLKLNMRDTSWLHLICVWLLMVMSVIHTCHNKLNCTFKIPCKASLHFTFKFGIVPRVDVLDNQGSSSFNFNSSFVRWRNFRMFLHTTTIIKNHSGKCTFYQNTKESTLNLIKWISVVPHQVGITTIVKIAWIRRFPGETHIHTP